MKSIIVSLLALAFVGCAAQSVTTGTKQLSREFVEKNVVKGKTTKAEVRALLGEPQSTTSMNYSNLPNMPAEMWTYSKRFMRDPSEKGLAYGVAYNMATGSMYDRIEITVLVVSFNASGRAVGLTFSQSHSGANQ